VSCTETTGWISHALLAAEPPGSVLNANAVAVAALMVKEELTALVNREAEAVRVYPDAAVSIRTASNVATPFIAVTVAMPSSSAEESPVPEVIARVMSELASVTVLPRLSIITTVVLSAEISPAVPPGDWTLNASAEALADKMLNPEVTALVSPVLESVRVYPEPALSMLRPLKVATPLDTLTVVDPERMAPEVPVPEVMEAVTEADDDVITLP